MAFFGDLLKEEGLVVEIGPNLVFAKSVADGWQWRWLLASGR